MPIKQRRVIKTTLGDPVVAVTDEVMPFVREPSALYPVVSWIFNDVIARRRRRIHKWSRDKYPSRWATRCMSRFSAEAVFHQSLGENHE